MMKKIFWVLALSLLASPLQAQTVWDEEDAKTFGGIPSTSCPLDDPQAKEEVGKHMAWLGLTLEVAPPDKDLRPGVLALVRALHRIDAACTGRPWHAAWRSRILELADQAGGKSTLAQATVITVDTPLARAAAQAARLTAEVRTHPPEGF